MVFFSQSFTTKVNIADGATSTENFISEELGWEAGPFDSITIINNDSTTLEFNLDGNVDNKITILPNSQENGKDLNFRNFSIKSVGGQHTAGKVAILVENTKFPRRK